MKDNFLEVRILYGLLQLIVRLPEVEAVLLHLGRLIVLIRALIKHIFWHVAVGVNALDESRLVDKGHCLLLLRLNLLLIATLDVIW